MVCPNKSNPYHQCTSYCAEKFGEKQTTQKKPDSSKKKQNEEKSSAKSQQRNNIMECPNISNSYHECSDYCVQRWRNGNHQPPPKPTSPQNQSKQFNNQQQNTSNSDLGSTIRELLAVIEDLQKSKNALQSENESLKKDREQQKKDINNNQSQNGRITNLDGYSTLQLKQMIKEEKDYLKMLKKKLEDVEELQDDLNMCIVCLSNPKEMIVIPCGHKVLCQQCAKQKWTECPICKAPVSSLLKVFE